MLKLYTTSAVGATPLHSLTWTFQSKSLRCPAAIELLASRMALARSSCRDANVLPTTAAYSGAATPVVHPIHQSQSAPLRRVEWGAGNRRAQSSGTFAWHNGAVPTDACRLRPQLDLQDDATAHGGRFSEQCALCMLRAGMSHLLWGQPLRRRILKHRLVLHNQRLGPGGVAPGGPAHLVDGPMQQLRGASAAREQSP